MRKRAPGLFITATDTGVGKTYVAALIARSLVAAGHAVGVYKPVASGCSLAGEELLSDDALALWKAAGSPGTLAEVCPQRFAAPLAPHRAAEAEGKAVDEQQLIDGLNVWLDRSEILLVEGAGGLLSPLAPGTLNADLATTFGYPLVIVAANRLGTINHTLQTVLAAKHYELPIAGIVLNDCGSERDESAATNLADLRQFCDVPVLATVAHSSMTFEQKVDWFVKAN